MFHSGARQLLQVFIAQVVVICSSHVLVGEIDAAYRLIVGKSATGTYAAR